MTCQKIRLPGGTVAIVCGLRLRKKRSALPKLWPATGDEVKAAGYVSGGRGICKGCKMQMVWVRTPQGKSMPLTKTLDGLKWEPHWATCSARDQFKKAKP